LEVASRLAADPALTKDSRLTITRELRLLARAHPVDAFW